jgi:DNA-binding protein HU-beta
MCYQEKAVTLGGCGDAAAGAVCPRRQKYFMIRGDGRQDTHFPSKTPWLLGKFSQTPTRRKGEETMTKAELIAQVAGEAQVRKVDAEKAINSLIRIVSETLKSQGRLALAGFGTFAVSERKAREGRNPQTGKPIKIPATKVVKFKPGKQLKDMVK